ncbi:MAG TPA: hypothetical protein GX505_09340 [Clostridiales bacterium]|nr:hypothetical protein [Clostridiales bacterium]
MSVNNVKGAYVWLVPDCYYPSISSPGHYVSHESICVLNVGKQDANIQLTLYFEDREPMRNFKAVCKAERTNHIRLDKIKGEDGRTIPQDVPYAIMLESDQPVVVQYSRLDTTQAEMSLMTTMAHPLT